MADTLNKPISFILFIGIGLLLRKKISAGNETNGLKHLILSVVLPITIFIALLKIKVGSNLIMFPILALGLNILLFAISPFLLNLVGLDTSSAPGKSARILLPSLAPGLSCFAFILEFLGDEPLAKAAMADLGNKFFVLFILYLVAMKWHYKQGEFEQEPFSEKLKSLVLTLICEPVNLFILVALIFIGFGITLDTLPKFINLTLTRLSNIMTPLVLIFIGVAVQINKKQFFQIASLLVLRAAFVLLLISAMAGLFGVAVNNDVLVIVMFALSACSFWPFAHIANVNYKEKKMAVPKNNRTFSTNFALSILAISLPLSVVLILGVLTFKATLISPLHIAFLGFSLLVIGVIYPIAIKLKTPVLREKLNLSTTNKKTT